MFKAIFGLATDVWAYGVVLWEIFAYGQTPFDKLGGLDLQTQVRVFCVPCGRAQFGSGAESWRARACARA